MILSTDRDLVVCRSDVPQLEQKCALSGISVELQFRQIMKINIPYSETCHSSYVDSLEPQSWPINRVQKNLHITLAGVRPKSYF